PPPPPETRRTPRTPARPAGLWSPRAPPASRGAEAIIPEMAAARQRLKCGDARAETPIWRGDPKSATPEFPGVTGEHALTSFFRDLAIVVSPRRVLRGAACRCPTAGHRGQCRTLNTMALISNP